MIKLRKSDERFHLEAGWLSTNWSFSFAHYHDPDHTSFGPLRVFNDDVVQPDSGFPSHPHQEMEIITYVIDGELAHRDSTGGEGVIRSGELQCMSAGRGIVHSEMNPSKSDPVHFLQIWVQPNKHGMEPEYSQMRFSKEDRKDVLRPVVTPDDDGTLTICQDASIFLSNLSEGVSLEHRLEPNRQVYLFVIGGAITVNEIQLLSGDAAAITDEPVLSITGTEPAELIMLDLP